MGRDFRNNRSPAPGYLRRAFSAAILGVALIAGGSIGGAYAIHVEANDLLGMAASEGVTHAIKPIVWLGADEKGKDFALARAASAGQTVTVDILLKEGADMHAGEDLALILAASHGRTETVGLLLARGANANAAHGAPLMAAATIGSEKMVLLLLDHGANIYAFGNEAARQATLHGHDDIAKLLRDRGAGALRASCTIPTISA